MRLIYLPNYITLVGSGIMSNITSILNPILQLSSRQDDCLPCTTTQSVLSIMGGYYLYLGALFRSRNGKIDLKKHPIWWQNSIRTIGILIVGLGAYRAGEAVQILWNRYENRKLSP